MFDLRLCVSSVYHTFTAGTMLLRSASVIYDDLVAEVERFGVGGWRDIEEVHYKQRRPCLAVQRGGD